MRSPIKPILFAGAMAFASATFAHGTSSADATVAPSIDYKAEYARCAKLPGSDQARCHDMVGMRQSEISRRGVPDDRMASLQSGDRCDYLNPDARRDCQLSDKAA